MNKAACEPSRCRSHNWKEQRVLRNKNHLKSQEISKRVRRQTVVGSYQIFGKNLTSASWPCHRRLGWRLRTSCQLCMSWRRPLNCESSYLFASASWVLSEAGSFDVCGSFTPLRPASGVNAASTCKVSRPLQPSFLILSLVSSRKTWCGAGECYVK